MGTFEDYMRTRLLYEFLINDPLFLQAVQNDCLKRLRELCPVISELEEQMDLKKKSIECEEYLKKSDEYSKITNLLKYDKNNIHLIVKKDRLKKQLNEMMSDE